MWKLSLAAAVALALAGCGPQARVDREGNVTVKGVDGTTITAGKAAPTNLPDYVKLYPGGQVTANVNMGGKGGALTYTVAAPPETVMAFYKKSAADAKLASVMDSWGGDAQEKSAVHVIQFRDEATRRSLQASVQGLGGQTQVSLFYGQE